MKGRKLRVLTLVEADVVTSPARIILNFAADCRDTVDVTLVTFARRSAQAAGHSSPSNFVLAATELGIPVETVHESGRFDLGVLKQLSRLIEKHQPDLIQTNAVKSHFLVSLLCRRKPRWIAFHHGYTSEDLKMRAYNALDRLSLRHCHQVVTVCEPFARQLQRLGVKRDKISVISNSISTDFLKPDPAVIREWRDRLKLAPDETVVISIGRLSPEKGHRYLLDAISAIMQSGKGPKLKVLIAGTGVLETDLAEQIRREGLDESVKLIGFHRDVKPLFMIADLFVLPSLSEGSPMVLLESMAARVPVIATAVGGIPETVAEGQCAMLIPAADVPHMSEAILKMLLDRAYASRMASLAFERVRDFFSPAIYNRRVLDVFERVLAVGN